MPPRSSLTSSFSITDSNNTEVVCPLRNQDGSSCRKRCIGEKRYRSMQEHIRRAHPEHYISKLPATEESFLLMINTPPSEKPPQPSGSGPRSAPIDQIKGGYAVADRPHGGFHRDEPSAPATPRNPDEYPIATMLPAASAAAALAQLHTNSLDPEWEPEAGWNSDTDKARPARSSIELPPIHLTGSDVTSEPYLGGPLNPNRPRDLLPSILATSPPGRSSTLPPLQRPFGQNRPRKQSITKRGREQHHKKQRSRGTAAEWLKRIQNDSGGAGTGAGGSGDRLRPGDPFSKAKSAEPATADYGKRWEDLIDAAASATEDIDGDRTPVGPRSPYLIDPALTFQVPQSPVSVHRASLPPFPHQPFHHLHNNPQNPLSPHHPPPHHHQQHHGQPGQAPMPGSGGGIGQSSYQASPLQQALTPPSYIQEVPDPFPSVESSGESGENFHMESRGLSDSSPTYSSQNTQIYCAACQGVSLLKESYACTECISGLCPACVEVLMSEQGARRKCPRCATIGGRFKPFQLDIR